MAQKWNVAQGRGAGRPGGMREISGLIVRMALENSGWGYTRIQGALANVGHEADAARLPMWLIAMEWAPVAAASGATID